MAYRDFKIADLEKKFGIITKHTTMFGKDIIPIEPSAWLLQTLEMKQRIKPNTTEKAVSESVIDPILTEVTVRNAKLITLFSGENLVADKLKGLNGEVDFLMSYRYEAFELVAPVINITEAKLNQAIEKSIGQAAAQMIGARIFNEKNGESISIIHGAITNGKSWIFLKLENNELLVDNHKDFSTSNLPEILGIFQKIIDFYN